MTSGSSLHNHLQHILLTSEEIKVQTNFNKSHKVHVNIIIKNLKIKNESTYTIYNYFDVFK